MLIQFLISLDIREKLVFLFGFTMTGQDDPSPIVILLQTHLRVLVVNSLYSFFGENSKSNKSES